MPRLTQTQILEILELFKSTTSLTQLSKDTGYKDKTIAKYWAEAGLDQTQRKVRAVNPQSLVTPQGIVLPQKCGAWIRDTQCKGTAFWRERQKDHYCCKCRSVKKSN
jgi:hypothetical protein